MEFANLAIQIVAGVLAGNAISAAMKQTNLHLLSRTILGAIGGIIGGIVFSAIGAKDGLSGPLVDLYSGAFGGAILTPIAGAVLQYAAKMRH